jgi:hypothetical protein
MSIKRILVPLPGSVDQTGEIDLALSAAKALGAHRHRRRLEDHEHQANPGSASRLCRSDR